MNKVFEIHEVRRPEDGCMFVTGEGIEDKWNPQTEKFDKIYFPMYCKKVRSHPESALCPHHEVIVSESGPEMDRKMQKMRDRKAYKKELRESLKDSPLAAIPEDERATGYEE